MKTTSVAILICFAIASMLLLVMGILGFISIEQTAEMAPDPDEPVYVMIRDDAPLKSIVDELKRRPQIINNFKCRGKSLLYYSVWFDRGDVAMKMLEMGANPNTDPETLFDAVSSNNKELVKSLLEHGANPRLEIYPLGKAMGGISVYDEIKDDCVNCMEDEEMKEMLLNAINGNK